MAQDARDSVRGITGNTEFMTIRQWRQATIFEKFWNSTLPDGEKVEHQQSLERSMHQKSGVALSTRVIRIKVDAMTIEGHGRKPEEQEW